MSNEEFFDFISELSFEIVQENISLKNQVNNLSAENNYLWGEIDRLSDLLSSEQISKEIDRLGIDMTGPMKKIRAALKKKKNEP